MKKIVLIAFLVSSFLAAKSQCQDSLFQVGHSLNAGVSGMTYQWYNNCFSGSTGSWTAIPGATSQIYTPVDYSKHYSVIVSGGLACTDSSSCVFIDTNCKAYFRPTQTTPGQVVLVDSSYTLGAAAVGSVLKFTWNFGDGNVAFTQYPTHTYAVAGTYQVTLYVEDTVINCSNFYHDTITVDSSGILRSGFSISVVSPSYAGIEESDAELDFNIFPNPTSDIVTIQLKNKQQNYTIELIDINGKVVYANASIGIEHVRINTQSFAKGVYMVRLRNQKGNKNMKLIIQ